MKKCRFGVKIVNMRWLVLCFIFSTTVQAQDAYFVYFKDKEKGAHQALEYLSASAVERRIYNGAAIDHYSDWPVNENYITEVETKVDSIRIVSRWFNGVSVQAKAEQIEEVKKLDFVSEIESLQLLYPLSAQGNSKPLPSEITTLAQRQITAMQGQLFHENGNMGEGIKVAIFDAGFPGVDVHPAFEHIRSNNRIKATYNFHQKNEFVYKYHSHGTSVMSNVGGMMFGEAIGLALKSEFFLARTEIRTERTIEEDHWLAAAEWAEKHGVQIINSSLGYGQHRYFQEQMDGKTALVSRAANMAASKGILVVNAAGNEGSGKWKTIGAPADADSVLAVGGINPSNEIHMDFGSYGPTADKRLKPNVSNYAKTVAANRNNGYELIYGTSFASPLTAGFAACALSLNPSMPAMQLFKEIEKSAHLFPYFDYAHGYGIPQAAYFLGKYGKREIPPFSIVNTSGGVEIRPENELPMNTRTNRYLGNRFMYVHIENDKAYLNRYWVFEIRDGETVSIPKNEMGANAVKMRVHLNGFTQTIDLK